MRWISSLWSGLKWVQRARALALQQNLAKAEQGDPAAQYALGERYHDGLGTPRDPQAALTWFLRAAQQGHPRAQWTAGMMLYLGRGSEPDHAEAVKWLTLAAEHGEPKARAVLDKISPRIGSEICREGQRRAETLRRQENQTIKQRQQQAAQDRLPERF